MICRDQSSKCWGKNYPTFQYFVDVGCSNDDCLHKTKQKNDDNHVVVFNYLKPGTHYEALLWIIAGDQTSGSVTLNFKTSMINLSVIHTVLHFYRSRTKYEGR